MSALAASGVTINEVWKEGGTSSRKYKTLDVTLVLSSQGGVTNNIPASLFGLTKLVRSTIFRDTDNKGYLTTPSYSDTTSLLVFTNGSANAAGDISATVRGIVSGLE